MVTAPDVSTDALLQQGRQASKDGKTDEALTLFEAVLAKDPANAEALHSKGYILQAADRFPEAIAAWINATDKLGRDSISFCNLLYCRTIYARKVMGVL